MRLRRVFLWTMIVSLSLAAALGVIAILFPGFGSTQERILLTSLFVGVFSMPALACAIVLGKRRMIAFMWIGIFSTLTALALWLILVWADLWRFQDDWNWGEFIAKCATPFTLLSVYASHVGLLQWLRLDRAAFRAIRVCTIVAAGGLCASIVAAVWGEIDEDWMGKTIGVLSILTACGTIVTPVLGLIEYLQRRGSRESIPSRVRIELVCPRCRERQTLPAGTARCGKCGLRIDIDVEEPRCVCGYLLYQLQSEKCPECGREFRVASLGRCQAVSDA
jgi:hypothetical protein